MTESTSQPSASIATTEPDATEALAHLAKMSGTGSAYGETDYVAINPLAIVSLLLGFASALSLLVSLFLFIPVVGILIGLLAIWKIRNSAGTQSGLVFALGGVALSLLMGGGVTAKQAIAAARVREESNRCAQVIAKFGDEIKAQHFDAIYNDMTTATFRGLVDQKRFHDTLDAIRAQPNFGELQSVSWAGNNIDFEPVAGADARYAYAMMRLQFSKLAEPAREMIKLSDKEGGWKIEVLPQLFPDPKAKRSQ